MLGDFRRVLCLNQAARVSIVYYELSGLEFVVEVLHLRGYPFAFLSFKYTPDRLRVAKTVSKSRS